MGALEVKRDWAVLQDDITQLARTLGELATNLQEVAHDQKDLARQQFRSHYHDLASGVANQTADLDQRVRQQPYLYMLVAFGLGYAFTKIRDLNTRSNVR